MDSSNNNNEIKKFLLNHKREFQEYLNNNKLYGLSCSRCLIHKTESELHYKNSCIGIYRHFATSLGKKPRKILTCVDLYSEMVRLVSNSIIIKNE